MTDATVLALCPSSDSRFTWQARIRADRGRLEVVAVVDLGDDKIVVPVLTDHDLRALLTAGPTAGPAESWVCRECGRANSPTRSWCGTCAQHQASEGQ